MDKGADPERRLPQRSERGHMSRVVARCARCRHALARAGAANATPCNRCGALLDGVALQLAFMAAGGVRRPGVP